jgi:outer membrane protein OmpA-like peptidoglycan-associated protein
MIGKIRRGITFKFMQYRRMLVEEIQEQVESLLIDAHVSLVAVDLIAGEIKLMEPVQFEAGRAIVKTESQGLLDQLAVTKICISQVCDQYEIADMHWRVEGHTAMSKKSQDGGLQTSTDRATAVCTALSEAGIDAEFLHPAGFGSSRPPTDSAADPRRVEIHEHREDVSKRVVRKGSILDAILGDKKDHNAHMADLRDHECKKKKDNHKVQIRDITHGGVRDITHPEIAEKVFGASL